MGQGRVFSQCQKSSSESRQEIGTDGNHRMKVKLQYDSGTDSQLSEADQSSGIHVFSVNNNQKQDHAKRFDKKFACPFAKYDPERWGQIESCGTWSNKQIGTVIRHHILEKHRELNTRFGSHDPRSIDQSTFIRLQEWKQSVRLEHRKAEELWQNAYMILFNIGDSEKASLPSPYFSNKLSRGIAGSFDYNQQGCHGLNSGLQDAYQIYQRMEVLKSMRDIKKSKICEQFAQEIRKLESARDHELQRLEQKYIRDLERFQTPPSSDYFSPQGLKTECGTRSEANTSSQMISICTDEVCPPWMMANDSIMIEPSTLPKMDVKTDNGMSYLSGWSAQSTKRHRFGFENSHIDIFEESADCDQQGEDAQSTTLLTPQTTIVETSPRLNEPVLYQDSGMEQQMEIHESSGESVPALNLSLCKKRQEPAIVIPQEQEEDLKFDSHTWNSMDLDHWPTENHTLDEKVYSESLGWLAPANVSTLFP